jgi:malate dehydrogenase (oxaloacetate-decarboxylating)(NADP+)
MADRPLVMALANPIPEILPEEVRRVRPDAIIATGRSDYPNQVNNILCFPFIFRGALDVGATTVNHAMKIACVDAIAELATEEPSDVVATAYGAEPPVFGPDQLIPRPFDPRLIVRIAPAVARAAMESGVATHPIEDLESYAESLAQFSVRSRGITLPLVKRAKNKHKRVVYAAGEDDRVLRAAQAVVDERIARPILIGREDAIRRRMSELRLRLELGRDCEILDPASDERMPSYMRRYRRFREGRVPAREEDSTTAPRTNVLAALMVLRGDADAVVPGPVQGREGQLADLFDLVRMVRGIYATTVLNILTVAGRTIFIANANVTKGPEPRDIADTAVLAAEAVRPMGIEPRVALLAYRSLGTPGGVCSRLMRQALELVRERAPELQVEGPISAATALADQTSRDAALTSRRASPANILVTGSAEAATFACDLLEVLGGAVSVGPVLLGASLPAQVVTSSVDVQGIVDMTVFAVAEARESDETVRGGFGPIGACRQSVVAFGG